MKYALHNGKMTEASPAAPKQAKCIYCGEWVELSTAPMMTGPLYFHLTDGDAERCRMKFQAQPAEASK